MNNVTCDEVKITILYFFENNSSDIAHFED